MLRTLYTAILTGREGEISLLPKMGDWRRKQARGYFRELLLPSSYGAHPEGKICYPWTMGLGLHESSLILGGVLYPCFKGQREVESETLRTERSLNDSRPKLFFVTAVGFFPFFYSTIVQGGSLPTQSTAGNMVRYLQFLLS